MGEFEQIEISEVISNTISMIHTQYSNHNIQLVVNINKELTIKGNKYKLEQVLLNLLSNAKYAVDEKERISDDPNYKKTIEIKAYNESNFTIIELSDNGTGIPADTVLNIFDPFFTTKKNELGTGLGLSISYGIVKELRGEITVDSEEGQYTRMIVKIPQ